MTSVMQNPNYLPEYQHKKIPQMPKCSVRPVLLKYLPLVCGWLDFLLGFNLIFIFSNLGPAT